MTADHERLTPMLDDVHRMVEDGELERAEHHFGEFRTELARHIHLEEQIIFQMFEELTGLINGPTVRMRHEHVAIEAALEAMARGLDNQDRTAFLVGWSALAAVLPGHEAREERVIYPTVDRLLRSSRREALVRRLVVASFVVGG